MGFSIFSKFPALGSVILNSALSKLFYRMLDNNFNAFIPVALNEQWNFDYTSTWQEFIKDVDGNIVTSLIWNNSSRTIKLFTITYVYVDNRCTQIIIKNELTNATKTTIYNYNTDPPTKQISIT